MALFVFVLFGGIGLIPVGTPLYSLGIDFGTSGARAVVLGGSGSALQILAQTDFKYENAAEAKSAVAWKRALTMLLSAIAPTIRTQINRIAINGTSATTLLCDGQGNVLAGPLLYNDTSARAALDAVEAISPPNSPVLSATSSLTKAFWFYQQRASWHNAADTGAAADSKIYITHQADWLSHLLHRQTPVSDYHNALKLGYDVKTLAYPGWLLKSAIAPWLPNVIAPGDVIGPIHPESAQHWGLSKDCQICAGTTDSIAAFLASGATQAGEAVTSLGSTLVLKLLSKAPIEDQTFGIYSHRLGNLWLAGGASNTGGAVLKQFFSSEQLASLSRQIGAEIDLNTPCPVDYYPLVTSGERFPINDPDYPPRLTPRPERDRDFLYGLLDGMARIEAEGYQKLKDLGAPVLQKVYTAGGGARNETWQVIRQQQLGVEVVSAAQTEAAYGTALLAMHGLKDF